MNRDNANRHTFVGRRHCDACRAEFDRVIDKFARNIDSRLESRVSPSPRARRAMYEWINKMGR